MDDSIKRTLKVSLIACVMLGNLQGQEIIVKKGEIKDLELKVSETQDLNIINQGTLTIKGSRNSGNFTLRNSGIVKIDPTQQGTKEVTIQGSNAIIDNALNSTIEGKFVLQIDSSIFNHGTIDTLSTEPSNGSASVVTTTYNNGINATIKKLILTNIQDKVYNQEGTIQELTQTVTGSVPYTGKQLILTNSGIITDLKLQGKENTINNEANGRIDKVTFSNGAGDDGKFGESTTNTLANSGIISNLVFKGTNSEVTLASGYRVELGSLADYDRKGALGITMEKPDPIDSKPPMPQQADKSSANLKISNLTVTLGEGVTLDHGYDLKHFILGTDSKKEAPQGNLTVNGKDPAQITAENLTFVLPSSLFEGRFEGNIFTISARTQSELSSIEIYQGIASLNQMHTQINNYLNSLSFSTSAPFTKNQSVQTKQLSSSLTAFATLYYTYANLSPAFIDARSHLVGLLGGVSKKLDEHLVIGGHLGIAYQNLKGWNTQIQDPHFKFRGKEHLELNGALLTLGMHLKYDFKKFEFASFALTPYLNTSLDTLFGFNHHTSKVAQDQAKASSQLFGIDLSILSGAKFATHLGDFSTEFGLSQQFITRPQFALTGFQDKNLNREIGITNAYPLSFLLQTGHSKEFALTTLSLTPFIKVGLRTQVLEQFHYDFTLKGTNTYRSEHQLDPINGVVQVGLHSKIKDNLSIYLAYDGDLGKKVGTHTTNLQINYLF